MVGRITELRAHRAQPQRTITAEADGEGIGAGEGERRPAVSEPPVEWLRINAGHHAQAIL
ncbi:hypothetical protein ACFV0O_38775 [Kitasatospora sp. NPDC059577]|uniref:hypothetical protein n=1 Tax=Kitasatospora sp. NPDC059577 TaxID=3346873 RepID=UPI0036CEFE77